MTITCTCKAVEVGGKVWHGDGCPLKGTRKLIASGVKSVYLAQRDPGFEHETNDCFVKALAAVTGVPYRDAHAFCATRMRRKAGRGTDCGAPMMAIENAKQTIYGFRVFRQQAAIGERVTRFSWNRCTKPRYATLTSFVRTHRTGKWLVWSNYHACAIIDGVVFDNGAAGARQQITGIYEFVESSKCEGR